ncbi:hypothetical protein D3C85_1290750 [compost metagenome]
MELMSSADSQFRTCEFSAVLTIARSVRVNTFCSFVNFVGQRNGARTECGERIFYALYKLLEGLSSDRVSFLTTNKLRSTVNAEAVVASLLHFQMTDNCWIGTEVCVCSRTYSSVREVNIQAICVSIVLERGSLWLQSGLKAFDTSAARSSHVVLEQFLTWVTS